MQVRLIVQTERSRRIFALNRAVSVIGRAKGCAIRIPAAEVSRRHCRLVQQDGYVVLEDLQSVNGTFLNGRKLTAARPVRPGDKLEVGPLRFVVGYELTPAALARLESFGKDVQLLPADSSGLEVVEEGEVEPIEWLEEDSDELAPEAVDLSADPPPEYEEPEEQVNKTYEEPEEQVNKTPVLAEDESLAIPADLHLADFLDTTNSKGSKR